MENKRTPAKRMARKKQKRKNGNGLETLIIQAAEFVQAGLRLKRSINHVKHQRRRKKGRKK